MFACCLVLFLLFVCYPPSVVLCFVVLFSCCLLFVYPILDIAGYQTTESHKCIIMYHSIYD